ncbi:MAG: Gfo/Idh/MocA family protein, partial [Coriobacteriia bacterium]
MLKAAVVGAGAMGRHHTRILGAMVDVELGYVVDPDSERAGALAGPVGAQTVGSIQDLPDLDIAVVATPTESHLEIASALMDSGVSVLVEKPLALNVEQATALVARAKDRGVTLAVGHVERFNPVVRFLS